MSLNEDLPDFNELLGAARHSAVHLEMRDSYGVADEAENLAAFRRGEWTEAMERVDRQSWLDLVASTIARGVVIRRARIVSEPVTDYIRFEHAGTQMNIDAGEQIRWLPRRQTLGIPLPGSDLWLIDGERVRFNHFTGDGDWAVPGVEDSTDPDVVRLCSTAFEAVWERGIPHADYKV
ncbi:DUF6879 family protein [Streptacidiphilus albus]|uniref:DUF6879 family protein n=1 Tax=Streptacidiphilus albus TaxID=105425 RepID=UPI00054B6159|nr:DUF6879 family protein [Streptacidiphilus albus]